MYLICSAYDSVKTLSAAELIRHYFDILQHVLLIVPSIHKNIGLERVRIVSMGNGSTKY